MRGVSMIKFLCFILLLPLLFGGATTSANEVPNMDVYYNGQKVEITQAQISELDKLIEKVFDNSRQMPALGVSLHDKTMEARNEGIWVEYKFDETKYSEELPFDSLLFQIEKNSFGVNLIRGVEGKYEGRCLYFDLDNNFDSVYEYIITIAQQPKRVI